MQGGDICATRAAVAALSSLLGGVRTRHRHGTAGRDRRSGGSHTRARIDCVSDHSRQMVLRAVGDLGKRASVASLIVKATPDRASCELYVVVLLAPVTHARREK